MALLLCHGPVLLSPPSGLGGDLPCTLHYRWFLPVIPFSQVSQCFISSLCLVCRRYGIPHWIIYARVMYSWPYSTLSGESALKTTLMLDFLQTCPHSSWPHRVSPCHQQSLLFLLSLNVTAAVCCFLCGWGRSIANEVCGIIVLLEDSSKVVNFLQKVVLCGDNPPGPVLEASHHMPLHTGQMLELKVICCLLRLVSCMSLSAQLLALTE